MKKYVKELGIEKNVFFYGVRFDVHELLQGMDIFLFPTLYEGLGNVITEAQAVSLQSVVSPLFLMVKLIRTLTNQQN